MSRSHLVGDLNLPSTMRFHGRPVPGPQRVLSEFSNLSSLLIKQNVDGHPPRLMPAHVGGWTCSLVSDRRGGREAAVVALMSVAVAAGKD